MLNHAADNESPSDKEGSSEGASNLAKSALMNQSTALPNESLNSSSIFNSTMSFTKSSIVPTQLQAKQSPEKNRVSIANLKICSGNENGEIMKAYRETIERYIKEHLIHSNMSIYVCPSHGVFHSTNSTTHMTNETLKNDIREFFQQPQQTTTSNRPRAYQTAELPEEIDEITAHLLTEKLEPEVWPFGSTELTKLLWKWARKIGVDVAAHIPARMGCFIGTYWTVFASQPSYKEPAFRQLNHLLFNIWLKSMIDIVLVNTSFIYQLSKHEKRYFNFFLDKLFKQILKTADSLPNRSEEVVGTKPTSFAGCLHGCFESLSRFVSSITIPSQKDFVIEVSYYFQTITASNLMPILQSFMDCPDERIQEVGSVDPIWKKRREVKHTFGRIEEYLNDEYLSKNYSKDNTFIVFSKKNALKGFDKILKKDLQMSRQYFEHSPVQEGQFSTAPDSYFSRREALVEGLSKSDLQTVNLLRDYIRWINLQYIEASQGYFEKSFTLRDLLERDLISKKLLKVTHIKMDIDEGPSYSAELAAEYLMHKVDEMEEDICLTLADLRIPGSGGQTRSEPFESLLSAWELPHKLAPQPGVNGQRSHPGHCGGESGALEENTGSPTLGHLNAAALIPGMPEIPRLMRFFIIIWYENKIRVRYFEQLSTVLSRSKAQFDTRLIAPFEITMKFGIESLEKMVAYQFVEKHLLELAVLNIKVENLAQEIKVTTPEEQSVLTIPENPIPGMRSGKLIFDSSGLRASVSTPMLPGIEKRGGFVPKVSLINTFEDVCNYMKSSSELTDYTTLGIDKKNFKAALHKILKFMKKQVYAKYEESRMKNSICLTDRFTVLIEQSIFNYVSSRIFLEVLTKRPTMKDFSFFMRCKSLNFMTLGDMIQQTDPDDNILYMEHYLDEVTAKLRQIDEGGSVYMIIRCIEQSIIAIADLFHIVLGFKTPAGSEDIIPILLYCIVKANLHRAQSIFFFLDLMMIKEERRGKDGFNFTQVETGINFVESMNALAIGYEEDRFNMAVMRSEINCGIHKFRRRNAGVKVAIKCSIDPEVSLF